MDQIRAVTVIIDPSYLQVADSVVERFGLVIVMLRAGLVVLSCGVMLVGVLCVCPVLGLASQGGDAMPRTPWRTVASYSDPPRLKNSLIIFQQCWIYHDQ